MPCLAPHRLWQRQRRLLPAARPPQVEQCGYQPEWHAQPPELLPHSAPLLQRQFGVDDARLAVVFEREAEAGADAFHSLVFRQDLGHDAV